LAGLSFSSEWENDNRQRRADQTMTQTTHLAVPVSERDHSQGPPTAAVTLVQYGDYECPYTRQSTSIVRAIQQQLGEQLRFVFRNFPLTDIHPHALQAAEAAEAADAQGRFWETHDFLFAHQHSLEEPDLLQYASELDLDTARFEQDLAIHAHMGRIDGDVESGLLSGVQGTPTFFINGVLHNGAWEQDTLAAALQRAMDQDNPK
jgi:protein-disulfide isomerase